MGQGDYDKLATADPLSEVRFVHDYVQLVFQPYTLSLYSRLRVSINGRTLDRTHSGYYDSICRLVGQRVVDVARKEGVELAFAFSAGAKLLVSLRPEHAVGPEVATLSDDKGNIMVERYGD